LRPFPASLALLCAGVGAMVVVWIPDVCLLGRLLMGAGLLPCLAGLELWVLVGWYLKGFSGSL